MVGVADFANSFGGVSVHGDDPDDDFAAPIGDVGGLAVGDLDGEGRADVLAQLPFPPSSTSPVSLTPLRSTGTSFTGFGAGGAYTSIDAGSVDARDLEVAAVDSDDNLDIVVSDAEHRQMAWWHGNGAGGVLSLNGIARVPRSLDAVPGTIALGDITGDTKPDLVVAYPDVDFARVSLHTNIST